MDTIATLVSVALQYGVPVASLVKKFEHVRFEPSGMTRNHDIPMAKSPVDYIFRWLAMEFIDGYRAVNAPHRPSREVVVEAPAAEPSEDVAAEHAKKPSRFADDSNDEPRTPNPERSRTGPAHGKAYSSATSTSVSAMNAMATSMQSDAPPCDSCGSITVRSGTCYKCLNCGASMGCS
jgi:ribonucleoside-diphosphate reductase alpha chain